MAPLRTAGSVDPGWEHGVAQDHSKKKVKCNYCGKVVSGGIYRLKQHLARISGQVTYCNHVPEEVCRKMKENLEGRLCTKRQRQSEDEEQVTLKWHTNDDDNEKEEPVGPKHKGKRVMVDNHSFTSLPPLRSLGYVDPGWDHGVPQDERKKKLKCNYCAKVVSGGINRFKQHLARIPGEVASCKNVPEEVFLKIKENMKWHRTGRRNRRPEGKELTDLYMQSENEYEEEHEEELVNINSSEKFLIGDKSLSRDIVKRFREGSADSGSVPLLKRHSATLEIPKTSTPQFNKQLIVKTGTHGKIQKEAISAICKFFCHSGIHSTVADSVYFRKMLELVAQCGPGLKIPSSEMISGQILQDEIGIIKEHLVEFKASWRNTGCTVVADSVSDAQGRTLINFLVSCPRGAHFVSSVDATDVVEDAEYIFKLMDNVIDEMGEENVVQVVTEDTACYREAGKMLEVKRRNLFWTPCAAYCIERMLEDFLNIKWVGECMEKGQKLTKFIYNRSWLIDLLKEFIEEGVLLRPAATRMTTSFLNLQNLSEHRDSIKRMFQSNKWLTSQIAKSVEGKEIENIVLSSTLWKKVQFVNKSVEPILRVLQKVDSDEGLMMASLYNDINRAKFAIRSIHGDDCRKYEPFVSVIEKHCEPLFEHPLFMAAYFLNPSYWYSSDYLEDPKVMRRVNDCISRLEHDGGQISASLQLADYMSAKADFGTELAVATRTELDPAAWWRQHGINSLELQRIAVRILSQTCSSFGHEEHKSTYHQIDNKSQNLLAQKKLNDFVYVHHNLRLRNRHLRRKSNSSVSLENVLFDNLLDDWTMETDKQVLQEDEDANGVHQHAIIVADENGVPHEAQLAAMFEPMEVQPQMAVANDDEDDDLHLLDDEFD